MKQNPDFSPAAAMELLKTPEGQQLLSLVKQADPSIMRQAMAAMQSGDTAKAASLLSPLAQEPQVQRLLRQLQTGR